MSIARALTVAGSDSGGGAGIQADIKTFQELNVFGMSAITAVTVQNTLGVQGLFPLSAAAVAEQINTVGTDLGVDAIKTGMLFSADIIEAVADQIEVFGWKNVVVDPVIVAKGGAELLRKDAVDSLKSRLLPLALIVTPNIPEAEALAGMPITTMEDRREAAIKISEYGTRMVVIKGGHDPLTDKVVDLLYDGHSFTLLEGRRIATRHTHGTGCTFSAAITAELAKGINVNEAVRTARSFIQAAIEDTLGIGEGNGPTNHWAYSRRKESVR
ncbi:bifunctional hydroxymethylpyrimidine kinase/phosphomethylpyrimidine kinase [Paenibacillus dokdonensis]|uniref:Hydroxymethylpyrimidine/phosphomethylpyrimidine kinase n=1 Tax=Paenibacillus dokdonensis TaxID=2567944 RepID=A0ABU6GUZ3_9BACL|nr:bifunctional hydroxymethylpyrimidine kinase/phosphomethylpyrimidine kinase [Paenibacillus dokdonensis]MEC0243164.1 bifunctional hydroxymethylpyrimidine kinase/phosphomethylpyrimidine kinase [Paenibacillus dokdonensis]